MLKTKNRRSEMEEKSFVYQTLDCLKNYECGELIFFILSKDAEIYVNHDDRLFHAYKTILSTLKLINKWFTHLKALKSR